MASWDDVERIALALPEVEERPAYGQRAWRVRKKLFVWERPLREKEVAELGDAAPDGPILGARVEDMLAKEALIADEPRLYFATSHFDGSASVLVRLDRIGRADLEERSPRPGSRGRRNGSPASTSRVSAESSAPAPTSSTAPARASSNAPRARAPSAPT